VGPGPWAKPRAPGLAMAPRGTADPRAGAAQHPAPGGEWKERAAELRGGVNASQMLR